MNSEQSQQTLQTIHAFTQFSDAKAGVLITLLTGAMVFFVSAAQEVFKIPDPSCAIFVWKALVIMGTFLTIAAIASAIISIFPRLEVGQAKSNIFFAHIGQSKTADDYIAKVKSTNPPYSYSEDLLNQIWASSKVAWEKYYYVAWSIRLGLVGLTVLLVPWLINLTSVIFK